MLMKQRTYVDDRVRRYIKKYAIRLLAQSNNDIEYATTYPQRQQLQPQEATQVEAILSSGVNSNDISLIVEIISQECQELGIVSSSSNMISIMSPAPLVSENPNAQLSSPVGTLGRVIICRVSETIPHDILEDLEEGICEQMDWLLCTDDDDKDTDNVVDHPDSPFLNEAVFISFQRDSNVPADLLMHDDDIYIQQFVTAKIEEYVREHKMVKPLIRMDEKGTKKGKDDASLIPSIHVEMDGGYVTYPFDASSPLWDSSSLLVFDNLVNNDLRKRLLDVVVGSDSDQYDVQNGPDPNRWVRGGLLDVPDADADESEDDIDHHNNGGNDNDNDTTNDSDDDSTGAGWGLSDEGLEEICFQTHDAVQEMESILSNLFPDFIVSRLPEVVLGCYVTPMTANAPTAGDVFNYHIDADPNVTPSSPWTDIYGRYPNRAAGKPRFMSCLLYLNNEWDSKKWGAPTRFVDVPTADVDDLCTYDVQVSPGRCIIMDQDIGHTVVAPFAAAGKRPRYSLVWKLILHPKIEGQDMKNLAGRRKDMWPDTEYFGSAATQTQKQ